MRDPDRSHPYAGLFTRARGRQAAGRSAWWLPLVLAVWLIPAFNAHAVDKISVVGLFKNAALVVIDGKRRMLRAGQTSPEGVKLVAATSKHADIEFGGETRRYQLGGQIGGNLTGPKTTKVHIYPTRNNMYPVIGSINGFPVNFVVDTGATLVSMNSIEARRIGIDYRLTGTPGQSSTASGISPIYIVQLERVKVGDIELRNVRGAVHEGAFPDVTLLGMSFLGRLDMQRTGGVLQLEQRR